MQQPRDEQNESLVKNDDDDDQGASQDQKQKPRRPAQSLAAHPRAQRAARTQPDHRWCIAVLGENIQGAPFIVVHHRGRELTSLQFQASIVLRRYNTDISKCECKIFWPSSSHLFAAETFDSANSHTQQEPATTTLSPTTPMSQQPNAQTTCPSCSRPTEVRGAPDRGAISFWWLTRYIVRDND
jgi:hypothetical protein